MPIPSTAKALKQPLDPSDVDYYAITVSRGAAGGAEPPLLESSESIAAFSLALSAEAIAAGVLIISGTFRGDSYPAPIVTVLDGEPAVLFWLAVDEAMQGAAVFNAGLVVGLELSIRTNSTPARRKQRTATIQVVNQ